MIDLEQLNYAAASGLLERLPGNPADIEKSLNGDLWRGGLGYDGPMPAPGPNYASDIQLLRRSFVPVPKLAETLRRHVRGVVGGEPSFEIVGATDKKTADEKAIDKAQGAWWDAHDCLIQIQLFTAYLRAYGRACIRYDVPSRLAEGVDRTTGEPAQGVDADSFEDALRDMTVEVPKPGTAGVYYDAASGRRVGIYLYTENEASAMSISTRETTATRPVRCVQMSYLSDAGGDEEGKTIVRVIRETGADERGVYDCGGELLVLEAKLPPMIATVFFSDSMRTLEQRLSGTATMVKINRDVAGFPELFSVDLLKPTVQESDGQGGSKEVPVPLVRGPRSAAMLASMIDEDPATGSVTVRSGSITFREPVSSEPLRNDALYFEELIYAATHQRHLTRSVAADASGKALIEWRADYADSLLETKPFIEKPLRSLFKGTSCFAADLSNDAAKLAICKDARWRVDCQLNAGPMSADDKRLVLELFKGGLMAPETAIVMIGTEDVEDEVKKIKAAQVEFEFPGFPGAQQPAAE